MADLTQLDDKLGEVLGLARAAQDAATKVRTLCTDDDGASYLIPKLEQMLQEAEETESRTEAVVSARDGKKTAIEEKAARPSARP